MKKRVFISYTWGDGNFYAEELEKQLKDDFEVMRDKSKLAVNDDIDDFMRGIADCDIVVLVLTEDYSKSLNCMKEISYLLDQPDWHVKSLLLVIDTNLYDLVYQEEIVKYWDDKLQESEAALNSMQRKSQNRKNEVEDIRNICEHFDVFFSKLKNKNNPSQIAIVREVYKLAEHDNKKEMDILTKGEIELEKIIEQNGSMTIYEISEAMRISPAAAKRYIMRLRNRDIIESTGAMRNARWRIVKK